MKKIIYLKFKPPKDMNEGGCLSTPNIFFKDEMNKEEGEQPWEKQRESDYVGSFLWLCLLWQEGN